MGRDEDLQNKDDVFLVTVSSLDDPDEQFHTFVKGTNELAYFLLHYNRELYDFVNAEGFCPGNKMYWDFKELLSPAEVKGEKE
jgi:hypothetical protein